MKIQHEYEIETLLERAYSLADLITFAGTTDGTELHSRTIYNTGWMLCELISDIQKANSLKLVESKLEAAS